MYVLVPLLLLSVSPCPQEEPPRRPTRHGRITLPPKARGKEAPKQESKRLRNDPQQFQRDVFPLRRSKHLTPKEEEFILRGLSVDYDSPAEMALKLAQRVDSDQLFGLMKVLDRYGRKRDGEELHFLLMTRPMGRATARVVRTMAPLLQDSAKSRLLDGLLSKYAPVRKAAAELLTTYVGKEDLPRLIQLSHERKTDVRRKVIRLLGSVSEPGSRARLMEVLTRDLVLAGDACRALVKHGHPASPGLQAIVSSPAAGRSFGYAALALVLLEQKTGRSYLGCEMIPMLRAELGSGDLFLEASSAIALAALAWRLEDEAAKTIDIKPVVRGLLLVVAPREFVSSLDLLQEPATSLLVKLSGEDFRGQSRAWRSWWEAKGEAFVAMRRRVQVDEQNAPHALLTWTTEKVKMSFGGKEVPEDELPKDADNFILSATELSDLVRRIEGLGIVSEVGSANPIAAPTMRTLDLRLRRTNAHTRLRLSAGAERADRMAARLHAILAPTARQQLWQLYRDPDAQPDRTVFWRLERKWLAANPSKAEDRLKWRIIQCLESLDSKARARALDHLQAVPNLPKLIVEEDAKVLIQVAKSLENLDESDFRLVEMALLAPGEGAWRMALGILEGRTEDPTGKLAARLFELLGPERVVLSIRHPKKPVRLAAMHAVARSKDLRAVPALLELLQQPDSQLQRTAIYSLGVMHAAQARELLLALEQTATQATRRDIWVALGRIGGLEVVEVLKAAVARPEMADRLSAIKAMGEFKNEQLAAFLAARFSSSGETMDPLATQAMYALRKQGAILAASALRKFLPMRQGPARNRLVLLLAGFQDPAVVPDLISLLAHDTKGRNATRYLSEITGLDVEAINDRQQVMRTWYSANRQRSQAQWFLQALAEYEIETKLKPAHLLPRSGVAAVQELTRLLSEVKKPYLRVMVATMLRETTGVEYGQMVRYATEAGLAAVVERYRYHAEAVRTASKK